MDAEQCRRQAEHFSACASQMSDARDKAVLQNFAGGRSKPSVMRRKGWQPPRPRNIVLMERQSECARCPTCMKPSTILLISA